MRFIWFSTITFLKVIPFFWSFVYKEAWVYVLFCIGEFGAHLVVLKAYSWFCSQEHFLGGFQGTMWGVEDQRQIFHSFSDIQIRIYRDKFFISHIPRFPYRSLSTSNFQNLITPSCRFPRLFFWNKIKCTQFIFSGSSKASFLFMRNITICFISP